MNKYKEGDLIRMTNILRTSAKSWNAAICIVTSTKSRILYDLSIVGSNLKGSWSKTYIDDNSFKLEKLGTLLYE